MFKPILFKPEMVIAIFEGHKTQTRRTVGLSEINKDPNQWEFHQFVYTGIKKKWYAEFHKKNTNTTKLIKTPYGFPEAYYPENIYLWVRETWCITQPYHPEEYYFGYKAHNPAQAISSHTVSEKYIHLKPDQWKPSIHMPKEACRLFLENINTKVQRLHDMDNQDAIAEGIEKVGDKWKNYIPSLGGDFPFAINSFMSLWESIHGNNSWDENPWVWVIEFKKIDKPDEWPT